MNDQKQTGELNFDPDKDKGTTNYWGSKSILNVWMLPVGYVFPDMPYQSIGFQNAFNSHDQNSLV
jgi:hypothetical protein